MNGAVGFGGSLCEADSPGNAGGSAKLKTVAALQKFVGRSNQDALSRGRWKSATHSTLSECDVSVEV